MCLLMITGSAVWVLIVLVVFFIIGAGFMEQYSAVTAVGVVVVKAVMTQGNVRTACTVLSPDAIPTMLADHCAIPQTLRTEFFPGKGIQLLSGIYCSTDSAGSLFAHYNYLHKRSPRSPRGHSWR